MNEIFASLGIAPIINAAGSITPLSASPIAEEVALGMASAAQSCIDIAEAQGRASELIAEHTGAEAGIVTAGASAGLLLGAAACMAGLDARVMDRLPDTDGIPNEFIVPRGQRNSYDHAVRAAGGKLLEAGMADRVVGVGVRDTEAWELEGAVTARTAGFFYVARPDARPALGEVAAVARRRRLPLLVDAAAELPPAANLRRFIAEGADLVAFSGGKALGGPTASGILCGRRSLVASALLQQLDLDIEFAAWQPPLQLIDKERLACIPRQGIGRSCKVGKEQIVGLLLALKAFAGTDDAMRRAQWTQIAHALIEALRAVPGLAAAILPDEDGRGVPRVAVTMPRGIDAQDLAYRLSARSPSVRVDAGRARAGILLLIPTCLRKADAAPIADAFTAALSAAASGTRSTDNRPAAARLG